MASYRRRGNYWQCRWEIARDPESGNRRWDQKSGFTTKRDAREWYERNVGAKAITPGGRVRCADWLDRWLEGKRTKKGSTYINYEISVRRHIKPEFGQLLLREITPDHIRAWHGRLIQDGYSPTTVQSHHRNFSVALNQAVEDGFLFTNPLSRVTPPRSGELPDAVWDEDEIRRVLATIDEDDPYEQLLATALLTGFRLGELIDLTWDGVDVRRGTITLSHAQARTHDKRWTSDTPKSRSSRRSIAMPQALRERLGRERTRWAEKRLAAGSSWRGTNYVFCDWDGQWLSRGTVGRRLDALCQRARVKRLTVHGLRHTWATWLMERGAHPKIVQAGLGHATIKQTMDRYSHVTPGIASQAAELINRALDEEERGHDAAI